jgi:hypothetical protein
MAGDEAEARSAGNKKKWPEMWSGLCLKARRDTGLELHRLR